MQTGGFARSCPGRGPLVVRLIAGLASIATCAAVMQSAGALLELRRQGDFISANARSGLTEEALCRLLGQVQLILIAAALAALASTSRSLRRLAPRTSWLIAHPAVGPTILAVAIGVVTTLGRSFVYHGETHFVVRDDAMIAMRYAKSIAAGLGPVYNPGERVEGYTGPLWVLLLALMHLAHPSVAIAPLLALLLSWASVVATVWAFQGMMKGYGA